MRREERDVSEYIDMLNAEKKPRQHGQVNSSAELKSIFDTVRLVRSIKEPALPNGDYSKKLVQAVIDRLSKKNTVKKNVKRVWLIGAAAAAVVVVMGGMLYLTGPLHNANIVYAMEQAFQSVKAYHGLLELVETNSEGKAVIQKKLEVWADKEGRYFVKELEGSQKGLITANNGQKKWQLRPDEKQVHIFTAFPDPYRFTFELGEEVKDAKNAIQSKVIGEETISGRKASIVEVSPQGGVPYRLWIDKETKLPLQKQSGVQNALQYTITYTEVDFSNAIPEQLIMYSLPDGFREINTKPEQIVANIGEAQEVAGFMSKLTEDVPAGYLNDSISVETATKTIAFHFVSEDKAKRVVVLEAKSFAEFTPASTAILGKIGDDIAEIQPTMQEGLGVLGAGPYAGMAGISSIRWQKNGFEYAVVGNASLDEMVAFIKNLRLGEVQMAAEDTQLPMKPQVEVPVDLEAEENEQKSVDAGHSPWKLDPAFVAQVFVSLKISPEGVNGEYPVQYGNMKVIKNTGTDAVIEVSGEITPIRRVYLQRLVRKDTTGIWTVIGYDPVDK